MHLITKCQNLGATSLIFLLCLQELYSDDMRVWTALFEMFVKDLSTAEKHGIDLGRPHGKIYVVVLGNKGDWSYLASGSFHGFQDFPSFSKMFIE